MMTEHDINILTGKLESHPEIAFAYLHGSSLVAPHPRDIDVAVFLFPECIAEQEAASSYHLDFLIPLEQEIGNVLHKPVDIQILNKAPLPFRFRVVTQGRVIVDRSLDLRENVELLSRVEYFDFRPRREEYLKEALA